MSRLKAANFATATLSSAINDTSDTDIYVDSGAVFPSPPFRVVLRSGSVREIVEIQEVDGNILKCVTLGNRGLEGTSQHAFDIGAIVENVFTAGAHLELADLNSPIFTGTPMAPTPSAIDNSNRVATTEYVNSIYDGFGGI